MTMPTSTFTEVQHKSAVAKAASVTVTLGSTATAGNILVAYAQATAAITDPSGWTLVESITTGLFGKVWWKVASGSEATLTVTATSSTLMLAGVAEIHGPTSLGAHGQATLGTGNWYAPGVTIAPALGSAVIGLAFFKFKSKTDSNFTSGTRGMPMPGSWTAGLTPSKVAHPKWVSGNSADGRPYVRLGADSTTGGTVASDALSAHFGLTLASWPGSQSVQFLHDWWVENTGGTGTGPEGSTNYLGAVALELKAPVSVPVAGTAAATAGSIGQITAKLAVTGHTDVVTSASGAVTMKFPVAGTAVSTSAAQGAITARLPVLGTANAVSSASGSVTMVFDVSGTAEAVSGASGAVSGEDGLSGTATGSSGSTGLITATLHIGGQSDSHSGAQGALEYADGLSGTAEAISDTSGAVTASHAVSGTIEARSTASGALIASWSVSGTASAVSGAQGDVHVSGNLPPWPDQLAMVELVNVLTVTEVTFALTLEAA